MRMRHQIPGVVDTTHSRCAMKKKICELEDKEIAAMQKLHHAGKRHAMIAQKLGCTRRLVLDVVVNFANRIP